LGLVVWWKVSDFFSEPEFLDLAKTAKRNKILMKLEATAGGSWMTILHLRPDLKFMDQVFFASGPWV